MFSEIGKLKKATRVKMDERGLTLHEALDTVYNSDTYAKLMNPATGLYFQSPVYIYSYLDKELATGKM